MKTKHAAANATKHPIALCVIAGIATVISLVGCGSGNANSVTAEVGQAAMSPDSARVLRSRSLDRTSGSLVFNTESYDSIEENDFITAIEDPQSTFSIDVDTASYANIRRMITGGTVPPVGAVRIEELVNYFHYDYPEPAGDHPFSVTTEVAGCPWNEEHRLLRVGLKGRAIDFKDRSPCNLVFLLDVSGSMMSRDKLPLVKSALRLLIEELNEDDRIAIVVYAGASGLVLDSTPTSNAPRILAAIENLQAGGSTNGGEGIRLAYQVAEDNRRDNSIDRVILCTDGDFNVGTTSPSELVKLVQEKAASNVALSVLGFGTGNLKDSSMEQLADKGNGNYAYIDSMLEARKVLVEQVGGTLLTIAKDVKVQIDFNPQHVQSYRLLGYENRLLDNQDFRDDSKDAGEIGAGHMVTAFYEIVPVGSSTPSTESRPSEFVTQTVSDAADRETLLTVNLRYKLPDESAGREFQVRVAGNRIALSPSTDLQFASAVVAYGLLLRGSEYAGTADWDWVVETAGRNTGPDQRGLRSEFVQLAKTARRLTN